VGFATLIAVAAGCARPETPATEETPPPAAANVILAAAMVNMPTATSAADLPDPQSESAQLMGTFCAQACHGIPAPSSHSVTDWPVVLRRMWLRMERIDTAYQIKVPTNAERAVIMDYLVANALRVTSGDLPDAPGKELFVQRCGACHGLPDVRQHSAEDWVAVVRRMNGRMEKLIGEVLSQDELQRIVLYLERASRGT
jgi:cytochrome c5